MSKKKMGVGWQKCWNYQVFLLMDEALKKLSPRLKHWHYVL